MSFRIQIEKLRKEDIEEGARRREERLAVTPNPAVQPLHIADLLFIARRHNLSGEMVIRTDPGDIEKVQFKNVMMQDDVPLVAYTDEAENSQVVSFYRITSLRLDRYVGSRLVPQDTDDVLAEAAEE